MHAEPAALFVYGTLQPDQARWPLLAPFAAKAAHRPATVAGRLFDTGLGYPAAVFEGNSDAHVPGLIVELADGMSERALHVLDKVEGTEFDLYARVLVTTTDGEAAWSYAWQGNCDELTPIERWSP
ncbi:MAG: gamma-glutamylcyclotransferase family protein [Acidimicrobiales bacterium]